MKSRSKIFHSNNISFIDMLFAIIAIFIILFFVSILSMNVVSKKNDMESKADLMIILSWTDNSPHDIDLWLKAPNDTFIGYPRKENGFIFLDRDDLGIANNFIINDGIKTILSTRREVITFRGKLNGRYVTNVHFFSAKSEGGIPLEGDTFKTNVTIELVQINPVYKILAKKELILEKVKEEKTAFSFILVGDDVTDIEVEIEEPFLAHFRKPGE